MAGIEVDWMEYASDGAASTAYVSSATGVTSTGSPTITTDGAYTVYKWTAVGSGTWVPANNGNIEYLVVAGGGGGGRNGGAGGGAGGYRASSSFAVTAASSCATTVGDGGAGSTGASRGTKGSNSVFSTITSTGGGGGGSRDGSEGTGGSGGSGGGGGGLNATQAGGAGNTPSTDPSQGNTGGSNYGSETTQVAGGGGGASANGSTATSGQSGSGGDGYANDIVLENTNVQYAGGGGGAPTVNGAAGSGVYGGGNGNKSAVGSPGTSNTGGGGGGGGAANGGKGGSGIVVIRYLTTSQSAALQAFKESTIKTQGSYSLKVLATTSASSATLTKTFSTVNNLTNVNTIKFDMYSSRTGANIKFGIYEGANMRSEVTPSINSANTWQTIHWDISSISDSNKDAIDKFIITVTNADSENTFYLDNFEVEQAIDRFGVTT